MIRTFTIAGMIFTSALAQAGETAYSALRVLGKRDSAILDRVIEVRGAEGSPQPDSWKISVDEPRARGGVREYEVRRAKISGERTPVGRAGSSPMNFNQLNLDSDGAFKIANQETQKAGVLFNRIDYTLRAGTNSGAPVWDLVLMEGRNRVGQMQISADSGSVLRKDLNSEPSRSEPRDDRSADRIHRSDEKYRDDGRYLGRSGRESRSYDSPESPEDRRPYDDRRSPPPTAYGGESDGRYSQPGEPFRSLPDFFHRLGKRLERRSEMLENFFTGKSSRSGSDRDPYSDR